MTNIEVAYYSGQLPFRYSFLLRSIIGYPSSESGSKSAFLLPIPIPYTPSVFSDLRVWLHKIDRAAIYIFIAASYTPWLTLKEVGSFGAQMRWIVWLLALFGMVYQYLYHEK